MQRVERHILVIWNDCAGQWDELFPNGIVEGVVPINQRENVWGKSNGHWRQSRGSHGLADEVFLTPYVSQQLVRRRTNIIRQCFREKFLQFLLAYNGMTELENVSHQANDELSSNLGLRTNQRGLHTCHR